MDAQNAVNANAINLDATGTDYTQLLPTDAPGTVVHGVDDMRAIAAGLRDAASAPAPYQPLGWTEANRIVERVRHGMDRLHRKDRNGDLATAYHSATGLRDALDAMIAAMDAERAHENAQRSAELEAQRLADQAAYVTGDPEDVDYSDGYGDE